MFFENSECAFKIIGVFHIERSQKQRRYSANRRHTAIAYRIKGESQFHYGETVLNVPKGSIVYIPANIDYERISSPEELIVLHFESFGKIGHDMEIVNHAENLEPLFRKLLHVWESQAPDAYNRSVQLLYHIFEWLQNNSEKQIPTSLAVIQPGIELLQTRYRDPNLRIADLADACFISEVYFRKLFLQHKGQSPQKALTELRFRYACELMTLCYYTQKEVALLSGFSDVKYFRTAFKRRYGITPSEYIQKSSEIIT